MQSTLMDIVPKVMLKAIDKYVAFTDFEFTDETLESLKYYHSIFDPTSDGKEIMEQFANCCETGQLKVLKWLTKTYGDTIIKFIPTYEKYDIYLTNLAHYNDHVNVVTWLKKKFNLHFQYVVSEIDLGSACEHGMLDLAKNIIERGDLDIKDITYDNNWAFRRACMFENYDIAEWLEETYEVIEKSDDIVALYKDVFRIFKENQLPSWIARKINSVINSLTDHDSDYY